MPLHPMTAAYSEPIVTSVLRPDGKVNVGEPADRYAKHALADHQMFAAAGMLRTFAPAIASSYSLAQWQTPVRDQHDRGTCYVFASVAALEAAYRRSFGLSLDLSEQYACQLGKIGELYPDYATSTNPHESNTTLWGGQGNSGFLNVLCRCAIPLETAAPYLQQEQLIAIWTALGLPAFAPGADAPSQSVPQEQIDAFEFDEANVPTAARSQASYQGTGYTPINYGTADVEAAIASNHEVVLDITTNWSLDGNGVWQYDANANGQGHCVLVVGYDMDTQIFTFKNSWGGTSLSRMSYNCLQNIACGATTLNGVVDPAVGPQTSARWLGRWSTDNDGWRGTVVVRRVTDFRNASASAATKLGNWYPTGESVPTVLDTGTRRDVNGSFGENGRQSSAWVALTTARVVPGQPVGQPFNVYNFSWESTAAAGVCTWNNLVYGVIADRQPIAGTSGSTSESGWIGSWDMDHDGWQGTLTITGLTTIPLGFLPPVTLVEASYKASDGTVSAVTGTVDAADSQHLQLTIDFPGNSQPFQLYKFSLEQDNAAGTTVWAGSTFGVRLHKNA